WLGWVSADGRCDSSPIWFPGTRRLLRNDLRNSSAVVTGATALTSSYTGRVRRPGGSGKGGDGTTKAAQSDCSLRPEPGAPGPPERRAISAASAILLSRDE